MTIVIHDDLYYVAFRGTDDSLAGWEEDFKACYTMPVEAQVEAESYLGRILMIMMVKYISEGIPREETLQYMRQ